MTQVPSQRVGSAHVVPDEGMQTYAEPYPRYFGVDLESGAGMRIGGGQIVRLIDARGHWARVAVNGEPVGWVDGRRLHPPIGATPIVSQGPALPPPVGANAASGLAVTAGSAVAALASVGLIVGAVLDWFQAGRVGLGVTAFKIPVQFLGDYKTTATAPKLGYFLLAIGLVALGTSFVAAARVWRAILGFLALVFAVAFCISVQRWLNDSSAFVHTSTGLTDIIGPGVWVTGISGLVLLVSAAVDW